ncbi:Probable Fe(2+)-trafficking protein [Buchnera aphidicola (Eriosoma grossulariae)]|uniref:oxidative damage protection protein n=1 Tax=Buchnera aphidicola TaxID=9 RepID=UPI0034643E27
MNRIIYCQFFKKKLEGLKFQVYPGKTGKKIFNQISKQAWENWLNEQTKIINEKKLNMINEQDRNQLKKIMINFLFSKEQ